MFCFTQDGEESVASWELRVEGRLLDEVKYKHSTFKITVNILHLSVCMRNSCPIPVYLWNRMQRIYQTIPTNQKGNFHLSSRVLLLNWTKICTGLDNHLVEVSLQYSAGKSGFYQPILIMYIYESFTDKFPPRNR